MGPDGSLYIADTYNYRIRKVTPDGIISTVAGNGEYDRSGGCQGQVLQDPKTQQFVTNNPPALSVCLSLIPMIAADKDGSIYFVNGSWSIFKVAPDGGIGFVGGRFIGSFNQGFEDGIPATEARSNNTVAGMSLGPDGSLFLIDGCRIRKIGPSGLITTVAGHQQCAYQYPPEGIGGLATQAYFGGLSTLDVGKDGSLYFTETQSRQIMRVTSDGILHHFAGKDNREKGASNVLPSEGERPAASTLMNSIALAVAADGGVYIAK